MHRRGRFFRANYESTHFCNNICGTCVPAHHGRGLVRRLVSLLLHWQAPMGGALTQCAGRDSIEVIWRSFQLNPELQTDPLKNPVRSLAEDKGWSEAYTRQVMGYVTDMAREVGLEYRLEKSVVANSFDAHRLIQLGHRYGRQSEVKERLFAAYFTEGKNIADPEVLPSIGVAAHFRQRRCRQCCKAIPIAKPCARTSLKLNALKLRRCPFLCLTVSKQSQKREKQMCS